MENTENSTGNTTEKTMNVAIDNVGPHAHLSLSFRPGINRLVGCNGVGKTIARNAITTALGGKEPGVKMRDGAPAGKVTIGSLTLKVGSRLTRTGAPDVTLGDYGSVTDVVDPGLDDPIKADAVRIRALLAMVNIPVTKENAANLADGDCSLVPDPLPSSILDVADHVKLTAQKQARDAESEASSLDGALRVLDERARELPSEFSDDDPVVAKEKAVKLLSDASRIRLLAEQRATHEAQVAKIRESLGERPEISVLVEKDQAAGVAAFKANEDLDAARKALQRAELVAVAVNKDLRAAKAAANDAREAQKRWDAQRAQIDAPVTGPTMAEADEIARAAVDASKAATLSATGATRRDVAKKTADAAEKRTAKQGEALKLRNLAVGVSSRLGAMLSKAGMKGVTVEEGRLMIGDDQKRVLFADRFSLGQKVWFWAKVALNNFSGRTLPLDPGLYASLQPSVKAELHKKAVEAGILFVTEEPSDDDAITVKYGVDP